MLTILLAILIFGLLIMTHELGHYLTARLFDVHIHEFSIGMGPKLLQKRSKKTDIAYSIRLLPIGGYVAMAGEDEDCDDPRALNKKPVWQRIIITAAGGVVNILIGFILTFVMIATMQNLGSNIIYDFNEGATSAQYLQAGDRIVKVGSAGTSTSMDVIYEISRQGIEPISVTVIRDGERITLDGVEFPTNNESGILFGEPDFRVYAAQKNLSSIISQSFSYCKLSVKQVWESLYDLIRGRYGMEAVSGPVGVTEQIGQAASAGATNLLYVVILISVNLGLMNLLPIPALDGGRIVFQLIELIFRRKVPTKIEANIHAIGITVLMLLMVVITGKDILKLIK